MIRALDPARLAGQLESGEIDVALGARSAMVNLSHELLLQEDFRMAQRMEHPRGGEPPTMEEYLRLEHLVVSGTANGFHGFIDDVLAENGHMRRVGVSVPYYNIVPLLLQSTDFVCVLPSRFLSRYECSLASLPPPFEVRNFSLFANWHTRFDNDPARSWLRQTACPTACPGHRRS